VAAVAPQNPDLTFSIRRAREILGLSQEQVATAAGMSPSSYSRVERGEVDARFSTVRRILLAMEMSADPGVHGRDVPLFHHPALRELGRPGAWARGRPPAS
jgi:predicted transcriptional regulator